ncbi:MAG: hypothetical protein M3T96_04830 [Acidobacteriota bacterium]|nr:hypothetical protein [Acidobacteriota bacterium]
MDDKKIKDDQKKYLLAIEAALAGGSLSLWKDGAEIDRLCGTNDVSKAEDLLENIAVLLKRNDLSGSHLRAIAAATDAGSATGLKIGAATAQGLAKAFGCQLLYVSLWNALAEHLGALKAAIVLLPSGKNSVGQREYQAGKFTSETQIINCAPPEFEWDKSENKGENKNEPRQILAHRRIINRQTFPEDLPLTDLGENFATYIGKFVARLITKQ